MSTQNNILEAKLNKFAPVFRDDEFLSKEWHECAADRRDVEFIFEHLNKLPDELKKHVLNNTKKFTSRYERNTYIRTMTDKIVSYLPKKLRMSLTINDDEIRHIAIECADRCRRIALHHNVNGLEAPLTQSRKLANSVNVTVPYSLRHSSIKSGNSTSDNELKFSGVKAASE
jgi:hypothetical protein